MLAQPEEELDLICTRCRNKARKSTVVYLVADAKAVHVAVKQAPRKGIPQVCGGVVVAPGEEWLARVAPGGLVQARRGDGLVHRVRLGRRLEPRGPCGEWEGTALCGAAGGGWDPSPEQGRVEGAPCPACALPLPQGI